jgi:GNAT superfamily N-acetyltransferase
MNLPDKRRAIRPLLDERSPADAQAVYYAYYHPDEKTQLITYPAEGSIAQGYVCLARTGIDIFRPLITMRFPSTVNGKQIDIDLAAELIHAAIPDGMGVILSTLVDYQPILGALFEIHKEQYIKVFALDRARFEPLINVLVTKAESYNGLPRYIIRQGGRSEIGDSGEILASAGLNWRSSHFAELYVYTKSSHRRQGLGLSVVSSMAQHVLELGQTPIYVADASNDASLQLARSLGFVDPGARWFLFEGIVRG